MATIRTSPPRGLTLVETMVAMAVLMIGALGLLGMSTAGMRLNSDGRRMTRAATIAQDLVNQIQLWAYDDPRLANTVSNDASFDDPSLGFQGPTAPAADHAEGDLTAGGAEWFGVPGAVLAAQGFERFWNVAEPDDTNANGIPDGKRVAVIVRWQQGAGFRRIVVVTTRPNPDPRERL